MISQAKSRKKVSSGVKQFHRKRKLHERGSRPTLTKVGKPKFRVDRVRGGIKTLRTLRSDIVNVYDATEKKFKKAGIKNVVENRANRHFARANIMTKGSVIDTDIGKARITNRPGQEGTINAVLIKAESK